MLFDLDSNSEKRLPWSTDYFWILSFGFSMLEAKGLVMGSNTNLKDKLEKANNFITLSGDTRCRSSIECLFSGHASVEKRVLGNTKQLTGIINY